jgi:hypothetical protein
MESSEGFSRVAWILGFPPVPQLRPAALRQMLVVVLGEKEARAEKTAAEGVSCPQGQSDLDFATEGTGCSLLPFPWDEASETLASSSPVRCISVSLASVCVCDASTSAQGQGPFPWFVVRGHACGTSKVGHRGFGSPRN